MLDLYASKAFCNVEKDGKFLFNEDKLFLHDLSGWGEPQQNNDGRVFVDLIIDDKLEEPVQGYEFGEI